jgi:hypothetical protein
MSFQEPHFVNDLIVPGFVLQENVDKMKTLQLYPDDIWVVTYPKSGTHWTLQIARLIRDRGIQDEQVLDAAVRWPEGENLRLSQGVQYKTEINDMPHPRLFQSHYPYHLFPCGPPHTTPCKYINVVRNPKDVAVSYYRSVKRLGFHHMEWDDFWKAYMREDVPFGSHYDHVLSWWPHRHDENVLLLQYEDMKRDLPQAVSQIAAFMGVDLSRDTVAKIADLTTFEKMKSDNTANKSWVKVYNLDDGTPGFFNKGMVGNWKNFLSAEQSEEMDRKYAEKLKDIDIEFCFE